MFLAVSYHQTRSSRACLRLLAIIGLAAILLLPLSRTGLFGTAAAMSHGGYNFPVLPTPQQLPLVLLLLVCAATLVSSIRQRRPLGALDLLILLGCFLLPAAFGRSDTGHFLINTTPAALAGFSLLTTYPKAFRGTAILYATCILLLPLPIILWITFPAQRQAMRAAPLLQTGLPPRIVPFAPFSYPLANAIATPVAQTGFYSGVENMVLPAQVARQIAEIDALRPSDLLLPTGFSCTYTYNHRALRLALATPFLPPARRVSNTRQPLCDYIVGHYTPDLATDVTPVAAAGYQHWLRGRR